MTQSVNLRKDQRYTYVQTLDLNSEIVYSRAETVDISEHGTRLSFDIILPEVSGYSLSMYFFKDMGLIPAEKLFTLKGKIVWIWRDEEINKTFVGISFEEPLPVPVTEIIEMDSNYFSHVFIYHKNHYSGELCQP